MHAMGMHGIAIGAWASLSASSTNFDQLRPPIRSSGLATEKLMTRTSGLLAVTATAVYFSELR